ncbi:hypothetical protein HZ994_02000 [Akkermansiaceae bacterium]|nr:hypothetical protein HZ994_02000 [Akkermansiaceae bacterium]
MSDLLKANPFVVQSPEDISALDAHDLFVDVFTDFEKLTSTGHTFIHGPRGCGKSMMFRYMQPDCQSLSREIGVSELPYFAAWVPIKNMQANLTELKRLEGHAANYIINEHVLTIYILEKVLETLTSGIIPLEDKNITENDISLAFNECFIKRLEICRWKKPDGLETPKTLKDFFSVMHDISLKLVEQINNFLQDLALDRLPIEDYDGPLCGYHDFLLPFFKKTKSYLKCFPNSPVFLLLDDADNLNFAQTKILNSWIGTRTHSDVSIKVSTQLRYKTYLTHSGQSIDAPHDFSEIEISTVYTTKNKTYSDRIAAIIDKRLRKAGIDQSAQSFFPEDPQQVEAIDKIKARIAETWDSGEGRGHRKRDDVTRYARPDFIKELGGPRKSTHTYSYSGFDQLVNISSGIVRCFLEPASQMYSEAKSKAVKAEIKYIEPAIQNEKIREFANKFLHSDLEDRKKVEEEDTIVQVGELTQFEKLENLLLSLGGTFSLLLNSDRSERRVFSIAFSDKPDREVLGVLRLGIEEGYFHVSSIGNKEGNGRTKLYILNRRLAPCFNLDPTSFAGYLFVTNNSMRNALLNPKFYLRSLESLGFERTFDSDQMELF